MRSQQRRMAMSRRMLRRPFKVSPAPATPKPDEARLTDAQRAELLEHDAARLRRGSRR